MHTLRSYYNTVQLNLLLQVYIIGTDPIVYTNAFRFGTYSAYYLP